MKIVERVLVTAVVAALMVASSALMYICLMPKPVHFYMESRSGDQSVCVSWEIAPGNVEEVLKTASIVEKQMSLISFVPADGE